MTAAAAVIKTPLRLFNYSIFNYQLSIVMKTLKLILILTAIFLLFFAGCVINIVGTDPAAAAASAADQPSLIKLIAVGILGVYEVVVRIVPSVGDYSAVSWIIKFLKKVSDTLNITKSG